MLASAVIFSIRDANGIDGPSPFAEANLDLFFAILTGKVYTLGLLRTLNKRTQFRARLHSGDLGRKSLSEWEWAAAGGAEGPQAETSTESDCKTVAEGAPPKVTFDDLKEEGVVRSVGADSGSSDVDAGHSEKPGGEVENTTTSAESAMEEGVSGGLPVASNLGSSTGTLV